MNKKRYSSKISGLSLLEALISTAIVGIELKFSKDLSDLMKKMKENGFFGEYLNEKPDTLRLLI